MVVIKHSSFHIISSYQGVELRKMSKFVAVLFAIVLVLASTMSESSSMAEAGELIDTSAALGIGVNATIPPLNIPLGAVISVINSTTVQVSAAGTICLPLSLVCISVRLSP